MTTNIIIKSAKGMNKVQAAKFANNCFNACNDNLFNGVIFLARSRGYNIPAYTTTDGTQFTGGKLKDFFATNKEACEYLDINEKTASRYLTAFEYVLKFKRFDSFANGSLKFQYDKIILIGKNNLLKVTGKSLDDLMKLSLSSLKLLVPSDNTSVETSDASDDGSDNTSVETSDASDDGTVIITVNNRKFKVDAIALITWLESNGTELE